MQVLSYKDGRPPRWLDRLNFADPADKSGRMKYHTQILLFGSLMTAFQCLDTHFELTNPRPSIKVGSCVELTVTSTQELPPQPFYWFWTKDDNIILSSDTDLWPVHQDFEGRVKSLGPPPLQWDTAGTALTILMCDIEKSDSGEYKFAIGVAGGEGSQMEEFSTSVTVEDNPCPIYFATSPAAPRDNWYVVLSCTTYKTCPSYPEFLDSELLFPSEAIKQYMKSTYINFKANWQQDGKEISCQVHNNTDKYLRKRLTLNIKYSTRNTSLILSNGTSPIEGKNLNLLCTSYGNPTPTFKWSKNGKALPVVGRELTISSVTTMQNGKYKCLATNYYGTSASTLVIDVKYPPTVVVAPSQSTFRQGEDMTLLCNVTRSNPKPSHFNWYRDNQHVASNQVFTISSVQPEHMGWYKCVGYNDVGHGESELLIEVEYRPRNTVVSIVDSSSPLVKAGASVMLQCTTDANPVPNKYAWLADKCDHSSGCLSETSADRLLVSDVQPSDRTCYTCSPTNKLDDGEISEPLCIQVLDAPRNLLLSMTSVVTEGDVVSMRCLVESVPPSVLNLTWTSSDQSVRLVASSHDNNTLLYSFEATCADGGIYTCEAVNSQGRQSAQKTLDVTYAPKDVTVIAHSSLVLTENTPLKLECVADANPPVKLVIWWKATDSTTENLAENGTLTIAAPTAADAGFYGCTVTNNVGSARSPKVEVKVQKSLLKYIIPPVCVLLFVALVVFLYRKRKSLQPRRREMKVSNNYNAVRASKPSSNNTDKKSICNVRLLSVRKDPSVALVVQDEPPKDDTIPDASVLSEQVLRKDAGDGAHTGLEQQWSKETSKGTNKEDAGDRCYAQVHFKHKCSGDGDSLKFSFAV
ncbi:B-cell receptor CD22-like isoform X2 [Syngnathoides biaculeatus]|uniref:B-cell receptor CD22-like isoform X2 n=1 Tax=Syngnathoides biaculeatus TaxID=300417 RepID=UPI002ADDA648|nr:B-cell receptor CD22-like isoform X2 [Syngnathoides biaculeatus]